MEYFIIYLFLCFSRKKLSKQYSTCCLFILFCYIFFSEKTFFQKNIFPIIYLIVYIKCKRAESLNLNVHVGYHDIWPGSVVL